jgi:hypothetical protein
LKDSAIFAGSFLCCHAALDAASPFKTFAFARVSFFILIRMKIILLCVALLMMPCLANESAVVTPVDSAEYYQKMYEYNLEEYRKDEFVSDVMLWTFFGGMGVTMGALMVKICSDLNTEGSDDLSTLEAIGIFTPFTIMVAAGIGYIVFDIAKNNRQQDYNYYYQKWEDSKKSGSSMQVGIAPLLNPLDGRYGAVLAFSF